MANLGFIGLGAMGSRIVKRLIDAGHRVTGYNRTRAKAEALERAGMQWGATPRAVAETSEVVFTMVTDGTALRGVAEGPDGFLAGLDRGKVYVDMSTISPVTSREIAAQVERTGANMIEAPVSGGPLSVEQGSLAIMVAGDREAFERVRPLLTAIGPKVTYLGGAGSALYVKLAANAALAVQMLAFSEAVLLAEKNGVPREAVVDAFLNSALASPMLKYRGPFVLQMPETSWFSVQMMQKDLLLALEAGRASGVPQPTAALANEFLTAARGLGLAEEDFAALFQVLAHLVDRSGVA